MAEVILFATPSVLQTLALVPEIRNARTVYFFEGRVSLLDYPGVRRRIVHRLIRLLNPRTEIKAVPAELTYRFLWETNRDSLQTVDALTPRVRSSGAYRLALELLGDQNVIKYFQMNLALLIPQRHLFWKVAAALATQHRGLLVVPDGDDEDCLAVGPMRVSMGLRFVNAVRRMVRRSRNLLLLSGLPVGFVGARLGRLTPRRVERPKYDVKVPVVWGFRGPEELLDGVKRPHNDGYLYCDSLRSGQIVHVFGDWKFSGEIRAAYERELKARGYAWADRREYRVDSRFLMRSARYQAVVLKKLITDWSLLMEGNDLLEITIRLLYHCLQQELERCNLDYKVEFVKNDYNPSHVVATIINRRDGSRTVGIQHNASPYEAAQLAYAHLDRYIVFGRGFVERFGDHWSKLKLERTGHESIDWVVRLMDNPARLRSLRDGLERKYPPRRYIALITFPSGADRNLRRQWDQMYQALSNLRTVDIDCTVFLRFRSADHWVHFEHIRRFADLSKFDKRIVMEHEEFCTYELMAIADVVIASSASFVISEAVLTRAKVFTFDYIGTAALYFDGYGRDFVLKNTEDVLRVFHRFQNGSQGFDCDWDRLRREGNYNTDGRNYKRIQGVVLKAMVEVRGDAGATPQILKHRTGFDSDQGLTIRL